MIMAGSSVKGSSRPIPHFFSVILITLLVSICLASPIPQLYSPQLYSPQLDSKPSSTPYTTTTDANGAPAAKVAAEALVPP